MAILGTSQLKQFQEKISTCIMYFLYHSSMMLMQQTSADTEHVSTTATEFTTVEVEYPLRVFKGNLIGVSADVSIPFMMDIDEVRPLG